MFPARLRAAIQECGIPLHALVEELAARGSSVTTASLSYWQNGRSKPQRTSSLLAVATLEDVLGVRAGHLTGPLGRAAPQRPVVDPSAPDPDRLVREMVRTLVRMGPDRAPRQVVTRMLLRAQGEGARVLLLAQRTVGGTDGGGADDGIPARVLRTVGCRAGRVVRSPQGTALREMRLDRPLAGGEVAAIEVETAPPHPPAATDRYDLHAVTSTRVLALEVAFDRRAVPRNAWPLVVRGDRTPAPTGLGSVPVSGRSITVMDTGVQTGRVGLTWSWE